MNKKIENCINSIDEHCLGECQYCELYEPKDVVNDFSNENRFQGLRDINSKKLYLFNLDNFN